MVTAAASAAVADTAGWGARAPAGAEEKAARAAAGSAVWAATRGEAAARAAGRSGGTAGRAADLETVEASGEGTVGTDPPAVLAGGSEEALAADGAVAS